MVNKFIKNRAGYVALVSLLIVSAVALTISIAVSLRGIEELQMSFSDSQAAKASSLANACLEEGLWRLHTNWQYYSGSLSISPNSCIISVTVNGSSAILEASADVGIFRQKITTQVDNNLEILSWQNY